jgi:circadian clock protein KaiC
MVCTSPNLLLEGESILDESIKEIQPRRVVIDSLSHLGMYVDEKELRKELYRLLMYFKSKGLSSLSLWEAPQILGSSLSITDVGLSFLVDCIVLLRMVEIESSMRKALVVLKMRGSDHDKRFREFEITSRGIRVVGALTEYEGLMTGSPRRSLTEEAARALGKAFGAKPLEKR